MYRSLVVPGVIVAALGVAALLAAGVEAGTVFVAIAILACPLMMILMMGGMVAMGHHHHAQRSDHSQEHGPAHT